MATHQKTCTCCGGIQITVGAQIEMTHLDMPGIQVVLEKAAFTQVRSAAECAVLVEKALAEAGIFLSLSEHAAIGEALFALLKA